MRMILTRLVELYPFYSPTAKTQKQFDYSTLRPVLLLARKKIN
jgi:hypothetical protein